MEAGRGGGRPPGPEPSHQARPAGPGPGRAVHVSSVHDSGQNICYNLFVYYLNH